MDEQSGETEEEEVIGEEIGESEVKELVPEKNRMRLTKRYRELIPETGDR